MIDVPGLALALAAGLAAGAIFYGGLYMTVRAGLEARRPALLFTASFALRSIVALAILYLVINGDPFRILSYMLGFIAARLAADILLKRSGGGERREKGGAS